MTVYASPAMIASGNAPAGAVSDSGITGGSWGGSSSGGGGGGGGGYSGSGSSDAQSGIIRDANGNIIHDSSAIINESSRAADQYAISHGLSGDQRSEFQRQFEVAQVKGSDEYGNPISAYSKIMDKNVDIFGAGKQPFASNKFMSQQQANLDTTNMVLKSLRASASGEQPLPAGMTYLDVMNRITFLEAAKQEYSSMPAFDERGVKQKYGADLLSVGYDKAGEFSEFTVKENGKAATYNLFGGLKNLQSKDISFNLETGNISGKGDGKPLNIMKTADYEKTQEFFKGTGMSMSVPASSRAFTDWYAKNFEKEARGKGAEAFSSSIVSGISTTLGGGRAADFYQFAQYEGSDGTYRIFVNPNIGASSKANIYAAIEKLVSKEKGLFPYAKVEKKGDEFIITDISSQNAEYQFSKSFGSKYSGVNISAKNLNEVEYSINLEGGKEVPYSNLSAGEKRAFDTLIKPQLKATEGKVLADLNEKFNAQKAEVKSKAEARMTELTALGGKNMKLIDRSEGMNINYEIEGELPQISKMVDLKTSVWISGMRQPYQNATVNFLESIDNATGVSNMNPNNTSWSDTGFKRLSDISVGNNRTDKLFSYTPISSDEFLIDGKQNPDYQPAGKKIAYSIDKQLDTFLNKSGRMQNISDTYKAKLKEINETQYSSDYEWDAKIRGWRTESAGHTAFFSEAFQVVGELGWTVGTQFAKSGSMVIPAASTTVAGYLEIPVRDALGTGGTISQEYRTQTIPQLQAEAQSYLVETFAFPVLFEAAPKAVFGAVGWVGAKAGEAASPLLAPLAGSAQKSGAGNFIYQFGNKYLTADAGQAILGTVLIGGSGAVAGSYTDTEGQAQWSLGRAAGGAATAAGVLWLGTQAIPKAGNYLFEKAPILNKINNPFFQESLVSLQEAQQMKEAGRITDKQLTDWSKLTRNKADLAIAEKKQIEGEIKGLNQETAFAKKMTSPNAERQNTISRLKSDVNQAFNSLDDLTPDQANARLTQIGHTSDYIRQLSSKSGGTYGKELINENIDKIGDVLQSADAQRQIGRNLDAIGASDAAGRYYSKADKIEWTGMQQIGEKITDLQDYNKGMISGNTRKVAILEKEAAKKQDYIDLVSKPVITKEEAEASRRAAAGLDRGFNQNVKPAFYETDSSISPIGGTGYGVKSSDFIFDIDTQLGVDRGAISAFNRRDLFNLANDVESIGGTATADMYRARATSGMYKLSLPTGIQKILGTAKPSSTATTTTAQPLASTTTASTGGGSGDLRVLEKINVQSQVRQFYNPMLNSMTLGDIKETVMNSQPEKTQSVSENFRRMYEGLGTSTSTFGLARANADLAVSERVKGKTEERQTTKDRFDLDQMWQNISLTRVKTGQETQTSTKALTETQLQTQTLTRAQERTQERTQIRTQTRMETRLQTRTLVSTLLRIPTQLRIRTPTRTQIGGDEKKDYDIFGKKKKRAKKEMQGSDARSLYPDLLSVVRSKILYGSATAPSLVKRPQVWEYERNVAGFVPTTEMLDKKKRIKKSGWINPLRGAFS